jgi:hypothetical protein
VDALLKVNGWDEDNDSMGGEDYCIGLMLEKQGFDLFYLPRMMTLESEEAHSEKDANGNPVDERFLRIIKGPSGPRDASQRMLAWVQVGARKMGANYYGDNGIVGVRERVLNGSPFPVVKIPENDWRDGQALSEM